MVFVRELRIRKIHINIKVDNLFYIYVLFNYLKSLISFKNTKLIPEF